LATHKSSEKRARQSIKRSARNASTLKSVKTAQKKVETLLTAKDKKAAAALLSSFASTMGKAAQKGAIHKKAAARKISRVSKQISALK